MEKEILDLKKRTEFSCLEETNYGKQMKQLVEPCLAGCVQCGFVQQRPGERVYYEYYHHPQAKAVIVISHGFCESAEKYKELCYYFHKAGYAVYLMEHRGHGRSYRSVQNPSLVHVTDYNDYLRDLHTLIQEKVVPATRRLPVYLFGHSMGGCIAAGYLMKYPGTVKKAVLSSPMLSICFPRVPTGLVYAAATLMCRLGKAREKNFVQKEYHAPESFSKGHDTSKARFDYYAKLRRDNSQYQSNCATYQWVREAIRMTRRVARPEGCERITIPVLVFHAEKDSLVTEKGMQRFVRQTKNARLVEVLDARHEIYYSENATLEPYLARIFDFFEDSSLD